MRARSVAESAPGGDDEAYQPYASTPPANRVEGYTFTSELVTLTQNQGQAAIAVEALVTEVITRVLDVGRRGLSICGVGEGVGTTFTAGNLAVALSQVGVPTLLIDANMRNPSLQRLIAPSEERPGLRDLLRGEAEVDEADVVCPDVLPNLSLIYAGGVAPDAAELLAGDRFRELIRGCLRDYTLTIVDTPPANRWADARIVSKLTTYAMVVARRDSTFVEDVATLAEELRSDGVTLVTAVMNQG